MKVYIGADHAGFKLKEELKKTLAAGYKVIDLTPKFIPGDDYPIVARKVATATVKNKAKGVLVCGTGEGVCIAANKVKGARAVEPFNVKSAKLTREHEDANILCLSGWMESKTKAKKILTAWLKTKFSHAARHKRRLREIKAMER